MKNLFAPDDLGRRLLTASFVVAILFLPAETRAADPPANRETWEAYYMGGVKIGYGHRQVAGIVEHGRRLRRWIDEAKMRIQRFGQQTEQQVTLIWIETPDGQLVRCETRISSAQGEIVTRGKPVGNQLEMTTTSAGNTQTTRVDWRKDWGGFFAVERSLERQPMQPNQHRRIHALLPVFNVVAETRLEAIGYEPTSLLKKTEKLLKIRTVTHLPDGKPLENVIWTDRRGQPKKSVLPGLDQENYLTTREDALSDAGYAGLDLGRDLLVKVKQHLDSPHQTRRVVYKVRLAHGDPAKVFATGATQQVKSLGPHTARLTVRAIRPGQPAAVAAPAAAPVPADLAPNPLIQSDDKQIVALAGRVAPNEKDPWPVAQALERTVCDLVESKDFSQAFSTAAEVARTHQGDCTEHAVLLAALCRARKIPARIAIGLVYSAPDHGFAYHMWNEVWTGDRWVPLDATLGRGGIGAAHIKLADSNLDGAGAYSTFLPVLHVMGQLEIEIVEVQ